MRNRPPPLRPPIGAAAASGASGEAAAASLSLNNLNSNSHTIWMFETYLFKSKIRSTSLNFHHCDVLVEVDASS